MKCKFRLFFFALFFYFTSINVMADDFNLFINGSANDVTLSELNVIKNSYTLIFRGNTREATMPGIGIFSGSTAVLNDDVIKDLRGQKKKDDLTIITQVSKPLQKLIEVSGKVAKLDVTTNIALRDGHFLLDVSFTNSGAEPIIFPSLPTWGGRYNPITKDSWILISADRVDNLKENDPTKFFTLWLGGRELLNKQDFTGDVIQLNPGETRHAIFSAWPSNGFLKGSYAVSSMIAMHYISAPEALRGYAEFGGLDTVIVFDHDYPSKPEEIRAFKTHQSAIKQEQE